MQLEETETRNSLYSYCLGIIYADGLGVPEDIKKGVKLLQESDLPQAKQALTRFKKISVGQVVSEVSIKVMMEVG